MVTDDQVAEMGRLLKKKPDQVRRMISRGDLPARAVVPDLIGIPEVAIRISCTIDEVRRLISRGDLPSMKISERNTRVPRNAVDELIQRKTRAASGF